MRRENLPRLDSIGFIKSPMPSFNAGTDQPNPFLGLSKGYSNARMMFQNNNYDSLSALPSLEIGGRNSMQMGLTMGNQNPHDEGLPDSPSLDLHRSSSYNTRSSKVFGWQASLGMNSLFNQTPRGGFMFQGNKPLIGTDRPSALGFENYQNKSKSILGEEYEKILNAKVGDYDISQINNNAVFK